MSYYTAVDGNIYLKNNTPDEIVDSLISTIQQMMPYDCDVDLSEKKQRCIEISGYGNHYGEAICDIVGNNEWLQFIDAAELYADGESDDDFWRARKLRYENSWRIEGSHLVYDGDELSLFDEPILIKTEELCSIL